MSDEADGGHRGGERLVLLVHAYFLRFDRHALRRAWLEPSPRVAAGSASGEGAYWAAWRNSRGREALGLLAEVGDDDAGALDDLAGGPSASSLQRPAHSPSCSLGHADEVTLTSLQSAWISLV